MVTQTTNVKDYDIKVTSFTPPGDVGVCNVWLPPGKNRDGGTGRGDDMCGDEVSRVADRLTDF